MEFPAGVGYRGFFSEVTVTCDRCEEDVSPLKQPKPGANPHFRYDGRVVSRFGAPRRAYAGVMCRLIAYSSSSAFVLTFKVSIIRYL